MRKEKKKMKRWMSTELSTEFSELAKKYFHSHGIKFESSECFNLSL